MKLLATCFSLLLLVGCVEDAPPAKRWTMQHKAMTEEEISRIDSHVKEILSHAPQHLSGNDQDLDDYARVVYNGQLTTLLGHECLKKSMSMSGGRQLVLGVSAPRKN